MFFLKATILFVAIQPYRIRGFWEGKSSPLLSAVSEVLYCTYSSSVVSAETVHAFICTPHPHPPISQPWSSSHLSFLHRTLCLSAFFFVSFSFLVLLRSISLRFSFNPNQTTF